MGASASVRGWIVGQGLVQVEVKAHSFTDLIGLDNPEPSQLITFHYDSIRPLVLGFGVNRTITPYLDKFQLAETEFWVQFDEVWCDVV
jgi:hypothetical protein